MSLLRWSVPFLLAAVAGAPSLAPAADRAPQLTPGLPTCWSKERLVPACVVQPSIHFFPAIDPPPVPALQMPPASPPPVEELPTPVVSIRVLAPANVAPGQNLEYKIFVENRSAADAHHVVIRDRLPANVRFVQASPEPNQLEPEIEWRLGTVDAGGKCEIKLTVAPSGSGEVDNCVRVSYEHGVRLKTSVGLVPGESVARPPPPPEPQVSEQPGRTGLRITKQGPAEAQLYDAISFQLVVTNTGTVPLQNVQVVDSLPAGLEHRTNQRTLTFPVGTLRAGERRTVSYEVIAKATGRLCNRAVATADGNLRHEVETCVTVQEAKLSLAKSAPNQQTFNKSLTYRITAANQGTSPVTNLVIIDRLPGKTTFVTASDGGRLAGAQVEWSLGTLAAGASKTVELKLRPQGVGEIVNRAEARADRGLTASAEATTQVVGVAGLLLEVVDLEDPVEVGADTQYNIIVRNQGSKPATNIRITASVPAEMSIVRVQGMADHKKDGQQVVFDPFNLEPEKDTILRVSVRGMKAGDVRFRVQMTADQLPAGPLLEEESTNIFNPPGAR